MRESPKRSLARAGTIGAIAAALLVLWAGFHAEAAEDQAVSESTDEFVILQLKWVHQFQFAGYYAAAEKGFYRDAGLNVILMERTPGQDCVEEVLSGRANYGVGCGGDLLERRLLGDPVVVLAAIFQHCPAVMLARSDAGIATPHDMVGRRVMVGDKVESAVVRAMLLSEGVALDQVERVVHSHDIRDLVQGKADAAVAYLTNWPYLLEREGVEFTIIRPTTYGIDSYGDCLFTSEEELRGHSQRAEAFRNASLQGWGYAMDHPEEIIEVILAKYRGTLDGDVLRHEAETMSGLVLPELIEIGHMDQQRWKHMADAFSQLGMIATGYSLDGLMYDPTAEPARPASLAYTRWLVGVTLFVTLVVGLGFIILLLFNQRLRRAVDHQMGELSKLNEELLRENAERKRSEKALTESEERLGITLNSIGDAVIATDTEGRITLMNPVAELFIGWPMQEAREHSLTEVVTLVDARNRKPLESPVATILRESKVMGLESTAVLVSRDGAEREVTENGAPILDKEGRIVGVVLVFRDVSEQHRLEAQFMESQKLESVGRLAGGVAHDFNNLLGGILGYAEILAEELRENKELHGFAQAVIDTANRAADLTRQLLAFSRKGKKQSVPVDVHQIIAEVISILQRTIDRRIVVNQRLEALPSMTRGDPSQLESALLNLAVNARDAMPDGGEIVFTTAAVTLDRDFCKAQPYDIEPGPYVEVGVVDTGIGMSKRVLAHIFEPFFTTKTVGKGTGLGLAAVFGTVREHHGAITVFSQPGQGSAFKLYLPLEGADTGAAGVAESQEVIQGSGCILVVDDEEVIRKVARSMLQRMGYEVLWAGDGAEGVEVYRENARWIDLVILDLVMPKVNGQEALRAMKKLNPRVKVLVSTGFSLGLKFDELRSQGATDFIQKPFKTIELSQKVADLLSDKG